MPISYARRLTGRERSAQADRQLGVWLAFIAGAINAGGFLAVHRYTSHMTGIVSAMADDVALGAAPLALTGLGAVLSFVCGAAASAMLVNYGRRHLWRSRYAVPLLLEAALLLVFGLTGGRLEHVEGLFVPATVMWLCFIMGLQNAAITKISGAEIRTTHLTGVITDIGIELGKLAYWNSARLAHERRVTANTSKLAWLAALAFSFLGGGVLGAIGFRQVGYVSTVPLTLLLVYLASVPVLDDLLHSARRSMRR